MKPSYERMEAALRRLVASAVPNDANLAGMGLVGDESLEAIKEAQALIAHIDRPEGHEVVTVADLSMNPERFGIVRADTIRATR